ncbi:MAG: prolipoprotein diacylglyceryl transferase family protein [Ornithinimicrobium sp.]
MTSTVDDVLPGSGRISVTTRIPNLATGQWHVSARPVVRAPEGAATSWVEIVGTRLERGTASGTTAYSPFVRNIAPGVRLGAWPGLVTTGFLFALLVQTLLARHLEVPALRLFLLTVLACGLGMVAAKGYYLITHSRDKRGTLVTGMSVQGFVIMTIATLLAGAALLDLPLGTVLDATAPALLFGMAIGRLGCLLGGCCVGRPTTSRWGIWSSDRRVGMRRIPVQLLESALSAGLGLLALLAVLQLGSKGGGLVLVATLAAYILGRQVLFPLRRVPRATTHGRVATLTVATLILAASLLLLFLR